MALEAKRTGACLLVEPDGAGRGHRVCLERVLDWVALPFSWIAILLRAHADILRHAFLLWPSFPSVWLLRRLVPCRWSQFALELGAQMKNVVGDVALSSGIIAYLGAFTSHYRQICVDAWSVLLREKGITCR